MSNKETQNKEQQEKFVSKYDRKVQKRKEEKERAKREQRRYTVIGVLVVVALVCLVASFPIRNYLAVNGTYVTIGGEDVTKVEFDFNYNTAKNTYLTQYGAYMSMFGINPNVDLENQMYSETLTWKDFFEQLAVENMINQKAMLAQARAQGFTADTEAGLANFEATVKSASAEAGMTQKDYLRQVYGPYATLNRIKGFLEEAIITSEFYAKTAEEKAPASEEIQAYYEENPQDYDSVDYRLITINAEIPTEPTEQADSSEEAPYEPSEAEIAAAMAEAKEKADEAVKTVAKDGEFQENAKRPGVATGLQDWLFDSARKAGDTTVVENETANCYYVAAFENRYRDETPSVNARVLITRDKDGQALLDEWKEGEATEESFAALCAENSDDLATAPDGGLYEGIVKSSMPQALSDWLFDSGRKAGDTVSIRTEEDGTTYVMYFVGTGDPEWKLNIKNTLVNEAMNAYVTEISESITVEDPKGRLNYLKAEAAVSEEATTETGTEAPGEASEATTETTQAAE